MAIETSTNRKIRKQFCARLCLTFARFSTLNTFLYLISLKFVHDFLNKNFFYIIFILLIIIIKLSIKDFLIPQISYFFRNTQVQTQDLHFISNGVSCLAGRGHQKQKKALLFLQTHKASNQTVLIKDYAAAFLP